MAVLAPRAREGGGRKRREDRRGGHAKGRKRASRLTVLKKAERTGNSATTREEAGRRGPKPLGKSTDRREEKAMPLWEKGRGEKGPSLRLGKKDWSWKKGG